MDFNDGTAKVVFVAPWFNKLAVDIVCGQRLDNMGPAITQLLEEGRCLAETGQCHTVVAGLPPTVEFAKGMEAMVTYNVKMDLDVANGARGRIHDIVLNEEENPPPAGAKEVQLNNLPTYLLIEMGRTLAEQLQGLPEGVLPLEPISQSFQIALPNGEKKTVKRTQLPLTVTYAFTDYRYQDQTLRLVIVDIRKPHGPHGPSPFHVYVALSRSAGRDNPVTTRLRCVSVRERRLPDIRGRRRKVREPGCEDKEVLARRRRKDKRRRRKDKRRAECWRRNKSVEARRHGGRSEVKREKWRSRTARPLSIVSTIEEK